jgi:hypothetical protein
MSGFESVLKMIKYATNGCSVVFMTEANFKVPFSDDAEIPIPYCSSADSGSMM